MILHGPADFHRTMSPRDLPVWRFTSTFSGRFATAHHGPRSRHRIRQNHAGPQMLLDGGIAGDRKLWSCKAAQRCSGPSPLAWPGNARAASATRSDTRSASSYLSDASRICFVTGASCSAGSGIIRNCRGVRVLIFDGFHGRNLLSDVALALAKRLQQNAAGPEAGGDVRRAGSGTRRPLPRRGSRGRQTAVRSSNPGRPIPVEIRWSDYGDRHPARNRRQMPWNESFNPAAGICSCSCPAWARSLRRSTLSGLPAWSRIFLPLHGDLPRRPGSRLQSFDRRKIVVATNVAETSVTSTASGMWWTPDSPVSPPRPNGNPDAVHRAHQPGVRRPAEAGRAGRTAHSTCWRLWTERRPRPSRRNTPGSAVRTSRKSLCSLTPESARPPTSTAGSSGPRRGQAHGTPLQILRALRPSGDQVKRSARI